MRAAALLAALLLIPAAHAAASGPGGAATPSATTAALDPLADPGAYSLAPATPSLLSNAPIVAGGVASTSFGSNGMRSSSIELDSGLIGNNTRAFVAVGAGQGPRWHDAPSVSGQSFAAGVSTALPFGTTLSVSAGVQQDRLTRTY